MKKTLLSSLLFISSGRFAGVVPGVPSDDFGASLAYSEANGLPIVVFFGRTTCENCEALDSALAASPLWPRWLAEHPVVYVHKREARDCTEPDYLAARAWAKAQADEALSVLPIVALRWERSDGRVVRTAFTGTAKGMPAPKVGKDLAAQFVNSLDLYLGDFGAGPRFACGDAELDRLEATPSTSSMYVPLASAAQGGTLKVISPSGATSTYSAPASATEVRISVPYGTVGQKATLELRGANGVLSDTTHITYVGLRASSITYPKWVGESFDYGEWTMDYAAAKAKGGYVLAMFTGTLWCPYCHGAETSLLADPKFTQWAKASRVSLVSFDQGNSSTPATAEGNGKARLLTWEAGDSHIVTGERPSGAYYLSSKGISRSDAQARIALTTKYTSEWLAPGSTSARLGNPTFLLLKNDKVVGRFAGFRDGFVYDTAENLTRLNDLLKLASRDDESSDYVQTTRDSLALGERADVAFQVNSKTKCFRLSGDKTCYAGFALTNATAATEVKFEVVTAAKTLASATNSVIARISAVQFAEGVWLKATAVYPSGRLGKSSAFAAQIVSEERESGSGGDEDGPGFDPDGRPCLGWEEYQLDIYQGFAAANSFNVCNVEGAKSVSIKKVSGSLPSGVTLKYDGKTGRVVLSGTPKKTGTYTVGYTVTAKVGGKSQTGIPSTFTFTVADPAALNPFVGKAYSDVTVPLYAGDRLAGVLTVSITKANKVTAKYAGTESKTAKFSGTWSALDGATHDAKLSATVRNGPSLELSLSPDGVLSAELADLVGYSCFVEDDEDFLGGMVNLPDESVEFADYVGNYTVTLPDADLNEPCGTGFLTLKLTKSAAKTGKMTWSGYLHDGTKVSGNSTLVAADGDHASLVVFQRKGASILGAELLIRAGGAQTWAEEGGNEIIVQKLAPAYVLCRKSGETVFTQHGIYGGYLPDNASPAGICDALGLENGLEMTLGGEPIASVTATSKGFSFDKGVLTSLSYAKKTGIFSGKAKVTIGGKAVTGTISGVLLVNWISCGCTETDIERPYGSGTFYANGVSLPVDLNAKKE